VKAGIVTFREIETAHQRERVAESRALRSGKISARQIQDANSLIPAGATIQIVGLGGYLKNRRAAK
jgi:hypothetical protein